MELVRSWFLKLELLYLSSFEGGTNMVNEEISMCSYSAVDSFFRLLFHISRREVGSFGLSNILGRYPQYGLEV